MKKSHGELTRLCGWVYGGMWNCRSAGQADPATMAKQMEALTQVFQHVLRSAAERAAERRERTNTEDFDEEELEALQVRPQPPFDITPLGSHPEEGHPVCVSSQKAVSSTRAGSGRRRLVRSHSTPQARFLYATFSSPSSKKGVERQWGIISRESWPS